HAPETLTIIAVIGTATAFIAGTIGLVQNDIKRVLAYSTVSQLGYMFLAMGVGAYAAGIFHLYTHALFKALLFLGSGAVIHLHDAPPAMAFALIVLAIGSVVAGYAGVSNRFEHFLAPAFVADDGGGRGEVGRAGGSESALMVVSSAVALGGIGVAFYLFLQN